MFDCVCVGMQKMPWEIGELTLIQMATIYAQLQIQSVLGAENAMMGAVGLVGSDGRARAVAGGIDAPFIRDADTTTRVLDRLRAKHPKQPLDPITGRPQFTAKQFTAELKLLEGGD